MTKDEYNLKYWMFYMQLENDFSKTFNYVEFADDNLSGIFKGICETINIYRFRT